MIILDTQILLWSLLDRDRLSETAEKHISKESDLVISSMSVWEIGIKNRKGKLPLPFSVEEMVYHLKNTVGVDIIPVDENIWIKNVMMDWNHKDPADRTIVATAMLNVLPLVSSDRRIQEFYPDTIW